MEKWVAEISATHKFVQKIRKRRTLSTLIALYIITMERWKCDTLFYYWENGFGVARRGGPKFYHIIRNCTKYI